MTETASTSSGQTFLVIGILRGLSAALCCDGDEGFGSTAGGHWGRGPLIGGSTGSVGDR